MSESEDKRIGPYKIRGLLGRGGMGEVWRARDEKLGRDVAIKRLPDRLDSDGSAAVRFEREARLLASLQHQNIAAVYGLEEEEEEGRVHLVMECVEGENLAMRIRRGRLVGHDVLDLCRQVAEGLEAAHRRDIIHRDLKPGNIQVNPDGVAKILDFGLARALAPNDAGDMGSGAESFFFGGSSTDAPAAPEPSREESTAAGTLLGTVPYMSPEQARGQRVDHRSDIWSFGCILYECLCGKRPFNGETQADLLGAILSEEPDWSAIPEETPPTVGLLVRRCLTKDRRRRLQDIGDARIELEIAIEDPSSSSFGSSPLARTVPRSRARMFLPWIIAVAGLVAGILGWTLSEPAEPEQQPINEQIARAEVTRFRIPATSRTPNRTRQLAFSLRLSPTERSYAVVSFHDEGENRQKPHVAIRRFDSFETEKLAGTDGYFLPVFAPDGKRLFLGGTNTGEVHETTLPRGALVRVPDINYAMIAIGDDGSIVYRTILAKEGSGLFLKPNREEPAEPLTQVNPEAGESDHVAPQILPGSQRVLFGVRVRPDSGLEPELRVIDRQTGQTWTLLRGTCFGFIVGEFLVYEKERQLLATRIDRTEMRTIGSPVLCVEGLAVENVTVPLPQFQMSANGNLVYATESTRPRAPVWLTRDGKTTPLTPPLPPDHYQGFTISPDGKSLAAVVRDDKGLRRICIFDLKTGMRRLTSAPFVRCGSLIWSENGPGKIYFSVNAADSSRGIYSLAVDGSGDPVRLYTGPIFHSVAGWEKAGSSLLLDQYDYSNADRRGDIVRLVLDDDPHIETVRSTRHNERSPSISPDGRWMAFTANDSGESRIYLRQTGTEGPDHLLGGEVISAPKWMPDSRGLLFLSSEGRELHSIRFELADGIPRNVKTERLIELGAERPRPAFIDAGGERVLVLEKDEDNGPASTYWNFVLNFDEELRRLLKD